MKMVAHCYFMIARAAADRPGPSKLNRTSAEESKLVIHHGEEQEFKQETTAVSACYVPVCLKKKHDAHEAVWFTKATVHWSNFCIFVDRIGSQIILRMILESKTEGLRCSKAESCMNCQQTVHFIRFSSVPNARCCKF